MSEEIQIREFDVADYLKTDELIEAFLQDSKNEGEEAFLEALPIIARAKAMTQLAETLQLPRENIVELFKHDTKPTLETLNTILSQMNIEVDNHIFSTQINKHEVINTSL